MIDVFNIGLIASNATFTCNSIFHIFFVFLYYVLIVINLINISPKQGPQ